MIVANIIATLVIAIVSVVIFFLFREICPAILPKHNKKFKRNLLTYIEWKRRDEMDRYKNLYPSEDTWNEKCLSDTIYEFKMTPVALLRDMRRHTNKDPLAAWVNQNDRSVLLSRIDELERENKVGRYASGT